MLHTTLLILNAVLAVTLVLLILLQKQDTSGGGIMGGANLGGGPVMRNPLAKPTAYVAAAFMANCVLLAVLSMGQGAETSVFEQVGTPVLEEPALPAGDALTPAEIPAE